jgi:hypothetical protein
LLKSGKGSIPAWPALHQQSQLVQCRRWRAFGMPGFRRQGGRFSIVCGSSSRLHEGAHSLHARSPKRHCSRARDEALPRGQRDGEARANVFAATSCCGAGGMAALQLRRTVKNGIGRLLWRATSRTWQLCDWKCIFLNGSPVLSS